MNKFQILLIFSSSTLIFGGKVTPCCERPCPNFDLDCIRKYFQSIASCNKVGEVPRPLILSQSDVTIPCLNVTATRTNTEVLEFDWKISEFCINPDTHRAVLAIKFSNLVLDIKEFIIKYWLPEREPQVVLTTLKEHFPLLTLTTVFEDSHTLALKNSNSHAFFDVVPNVIIGPEVKKHEGFTNPLKQYYDSKETAMKEALSGVLPDFAAVFIQHSICDYGIKKLC